MTGVDYITTLRSATFVWSCRWALRWSVIGGVFHKYSIVGDTTTPSRVYARLCYAFLVERIMECYFTNYLKPAKIMLLFYMYYIDYRPTSISSYIRGYWTEIRQISSRCSKIIVIQSSVNGLTIVRSPSNARAEREGGQYRRLRMTLKLIGYHSNVLGDRKMNVRLIIATHMSAYSEIRQFLLYCRNSYK